jgi:leader peptidase (prepilin peptidase) / N-methyltransferase
MPKVLAFSTAWVNQATVDTVQELEPLTRSTGGYVLAMLLGLLWGSFANVCIYRWPPTPDHPKGRSVVAPGSHCSACKTPIRWYDNVPLLSYLWLRGRCRTCKAEFSPRYLLVEALTGALFGVAWWFTMGTGGIYMALDVRALHFLIYAAFIFLMVVITFIDLDHMLIFNKVTLPSIPLAYGASLLMKKPWLEGIIGAVAGYCIVWLISEIFYRIRKKEGLGLGDGKLLAVIGALLGWKGVFVALFGGSLLGSVIGIVMILRSRDRALAHPMPFGPFLAAAGTFYLFAEPWVELYARLL